MDVRTALLTSRLSHNFGCVSYMGMSIVLGIPLQTVRAPSMCWSRASHVWIIPLSIETPWELDTRFQQVRFSRNILFARPPSTLASEVQDILGSTNKFHERSNDIQAQNCESGNMIQDWSCERNAGLRFLACMHTEHDPEGRWFDISDTLAPVPLSMPDESTNPSVEGATCPKRAWRSCTWLSLGLVKRVLT